MSRCAGVLILVTIIWAQAALADNAYYQVDGNAPVYQKDRRMPEIRFQDNLLVDVIDFCRDVTGANIKVDWASIADAKVTKDTHVSLKARDRTLPEVLQLLIDQGLAGKDPNIKLSFYDDGKVIMVATEAAITRYRKAHPVAKTSQSGVNG